MRPLWNDSAKAIVIQPELDVWVWGSDNSIEEVIEWPSGIRIRDWLRDADFNMDGSGKPSRPKEAIEAALRKLGLPRSSALYKRIAEKVSLRKCTDRAFLRLRKQLCEWFPSPM